MHKQQTGFISSADLKPGDEVTLYTYGRYGLDERKLERKSRAEVIALFPHHVQFRMAAGYMQCFRYWDLDRMLNRIEIEEM